MAIAVNPATLKEFVAFALRPENAARNFEFVNGEVIEVMPGRTGISQISMRITEFAFMFCQTRQLPCFMSGEAGAYQIGDHVVVPDFAYKTMPMSDDYPDPNPPLFVVEVISPNDKPVEIRNKRLIYQRAGILYWEIYPDTRSVDVYAPGQPPRMLDLDDTLDGGAVLPGFTLPVRDLFAV